VGAGWVDWTEAGGLVYIRFMQPVIHFFSLLHRLGCRIRNALYDKGLLAPADAPLPVVSVGNISFGGSEKTPLAQEILRHLLDKGIKPALVTRGYRGRWERTGGVLSQGRELLGDWREAGDEPFMVALNLPAAGVYVGRDRLASCRLAKADGFQIAVLDDGFQHRKLRRDLDIVLFDPEEKVRLRESVSSLGRADAVFLKRSPVMPPRAGFAPRLPDNHVFSYAVIAQGLHSVATREPVSLKEKGGKPVLAFSGIARPERFTALLSREGIHPSETLTFPDHHNYSPGSITRIRELLERSGAKAAITTEKDAVKLGTIPACRDLPLYYMKIALDVDPEFFAYMLSHIGPLSCA